MSLDNMRRKDDSVAHSLRAVAATVEQLAHDAGWRVQFIGSLELLDGRLLRQLRKAADTTAAVGGPIVNIALAYSGRQEIIQALRELLSTPEGLRQARTGLTEDMVARHLYTGGLPDPDLIIRTSGEQRLSGFMPWQSTYSELYFCDTGWPGIEERDFQQALDQYASRSRRYGQ
ncbi:hypothetical protein AQI95_06090 [Streptomyces yokosukanensis]|uniref:Di-trans,poly-cis-decaprenylcistransferase n=1 Tax=Streptomyces yokosukanensis TaxID=67386 RepID=A0A101PD90_9ACTN|nr:hypothetical protein AQI95_06090 [Streptomyces yokosukanensis]